MRNVFLLVMIGGQLLCLAASAEDAARSKEMARIKHAIQSYVQAFNARDIKKLVGHWSPDAVYTSRESGADVVGRAAIGKELTAMFKGPDAPKLGVTTDSIAFISPNVALEKGTAVVTRGKQVSRSRYSVVFVKRSGEWLIDRVDDEELTEPPSNYDKLKGLDWLVGEWVDTSDETTLEISARWTKNRNFISRTYTVSSGEKVTSTGLQVIGWDAKAKKIRSWLFDSAGGIVRGVWTSRDKRWVVQSVATLSDGGTGSFTSIFAPSPDGNYKWQKVNRVIDGKILPNLDEVVVRRREP